MSKPVYRLVNMGRQPLRYMDGTEERETMRLCWHIVSEHDVVVAHLFEIEPDSYELWRDGEMTSVSSHRAALEYMSSPAVTFTADAREKLKERLEAIDKARKPLQVARQPLDDALKALDELHDAAIEEAGVEIIENCASCERMIVVGDLGHACNDGPVFCEGCAPTWNDLAEQYREPGYEPMDAAEHCLTLADIEARIASGDGSKKHVWVL